jgi:hypothetical protein
VLATAAWSTLLPRGYCRIGLTRGPMPKGVGLDTVSYPALWPIHAEQDTAPSIIHRNYVVRLSQLDPEFIFADLQRMAGERIPVLCAHTAPDLIHRGAAGCHRHLAAEWLERAMDIEVPEIGGPPQFNRFKFWREHPPVTDVPAHRPRTGPYLAPESPHDRAMNKRGQYRFRFD